MARVGLKPVAFALTYQRNTCGYLFRVGRCIKIMASDRNHRAHSYSVTSSLIYLGKSLEVRIRKFAYIYCKPKPSHSKMARFTHRLSLS
jgi:hypothetical protein